MKKTIIISAVFIAFIILSAQALAGPINAKTTFDRIEEDPIEELKADLIALQKELENDEQLAIYLQAWVETIENDRDINSMIEQVSNVELKADQITLFEQLSNEILAKEETQQLATILEQKLENEEYQDNIMAINNDIEEVSNFLVETTSNNDDVTIAGQLLATDLNTCETNNDEDSPYTLTMELSNSPNTPIQGETSTQVDGETDGPEPTSFVGLAFAIILWFLAYMSYGIAIILYQF